MLLRIIFKFIQNNYAIASFEYNWYLIFGYKYH